MNSALYDFGLIPYFSHQVTRENLEEGRVWRVTEVQRSVITVSNGEDDRVISPGVNLHKASTENRPTVGDWVIVDEQGTTVERVLDRKSVVRRVAAGDKATIQLIAANIDILFIVTSCNDEFKESRLERYLALAKEAGVQPVVVLTKMDLIDDVNVFAERARTVQAGVAVESINAKDKATFDNLRAWIEPGCTVALVGSSGVGKSTLLNALMGIEITTTGEIREKDKRGRHTTSHRALYRLPNGGLLIDVPGMRELKVADVDDALDEVFEEIETLAMQCQFSDCGHDSEPGCAVSAAVNKGEIDQRRLSNYLFLQRENRHHDNALAQSRTKGRSTALHIKQAKEWKKELASNRRKTPTNRR